MNAYTLLLIGDLDQPREGFGVMGFLFSMLNVKIF